MMRKAEKQADKDSLKLLKKLTSVKPKRVPVNKVSKKRKDENAIYSERRKVFLNDKSAKGRIGYADSWARDKGITLFLDERYWIPASMEGHEYIEKHPQEAKDRGWSQSRLENIDQTRPTI
jgi:hypothetical protein